MHFKYKLNVLSKQGTKNRPLSPLSTSGFVFVDEDEVISREDGVEDDACDGGDGQS